MWAEWGGRAPQSSAAQEGRTAISFPPSVQGGPVSCATFARRLRLLTKQTSTENGSQDLMCRRACGLTDGGICVPGSEAMWQTGQYLGTANLQMPEPLSEGCTILQDVPILSSLNESGISQ